MRIPLATFVTAGQIIAALSNVIPEARAQRIGVTKPSGTAILLEPGPNDTGLALPVQRLSETELNLLLTKLGSPDVKQRAEAAATLGFMMESRSAAQLAAALPGETNFFVQLNIVRALGYIGGQTAIETLAKATDHPKPEIRHNALSSLRCIGTEDARLALRKALTSAGADVRLYAAEELGKIKDRPSVDALLNILGNDKVDFVRPHAAKALGLIGDTNAVPGLVAALRLSKVVTGGGTTVESEAAIALTKINDPEGLASLRRHPLSAYGLNAVLKAYLPIPVPFETKTAALDEEKSLALRTLLNVNNPETQLNLEVWYRFSSLLISKPLQKEIQDTRNTFQKRDQPNLPVPGYSTSLVFTQPLRSLPLPDWLWQTVVLLATLNSLVWGVGLGVLIFAVWKFLRRTKGTVRRRGWFRSND